MPAFSLTTRLLLRHGLVAWPMVRALFALALLLTLSPPLPVGGLVSLGVIGFSVVVAMLAVRRRGERVLLANLGVEVWQQTLLLAASALFLEVLLGSLVSA